MSRSSEVATDIRLLRIHYVILPALTLSFGPVGRLAHNGPDDAMSVLDETRAEVLHWCRRPAATRRA